MTALSQRLAVGGPLATTTSRLVAPLAALHGAMLLYDLQHPQRFLNADRAGERIEVIRGFAAALRSGDTLAYSVGHGIVGDWLPQALLYILGGQYLVIAAQVILALASVLWVREIGLRVGLRESSANAAALVYALLPHTLVFPHQLATEAIFVPLVVLAFRLSISAAGGAALGFATLVRPITVVWPMVAAVVQRAPNARRTVFVAWALAPLLAWMALVLAATGEFSMGRSGHDLGANLYNRMQRMAAPLPESQRPPVKPEGHTKATLGEYLSFVAAHPAAAAAHSARDVVAIAFKSGIERVTLDYLDLFPDARKALQQSDGGWRTSLEQRGALATLAGLLGAQPGLVLSSALASVLFTLLMALAAYGAVVSLARREWLLLTLFVLYVAATAQVVDAAQSRHRAPAEFALCLLAVAGWRALQSRKEKRRVR